MSVYVRLGSKSAAHGGLVKFVSKCIFSLDRYSIPMVAYFASYGGYKLGANSANILVQDRITGQINEERMSVYVHKATHNQVVNLAPILTCARSNVRDDIRIRAFRKTRRFHTADTNSEPTRPISLYKIASRVRSTRNA
jgi:hypothetical protein